MYLCSNQDEDEDVYTNINDLRNAMNQISNRIVEDASNINGPDDSEPSMNKMMMLDAEFREKQNQLQTLIEQRKAKYVMFFLCEVVCNTEKHTKQ